MSEVLEKIADFKLITANNGEELFSVSTPDIYPFSSLVIGQITFMNIKPDYNYLAKIHLAGQTITAVFVLVDKERLNYTFQVDNETFGKTLGSLEFNLYREEPGAFPVKCSLNDEKGNELDSMTKYYSLEKNT